MRDKQFLHDYDAQDGKPAISSEQYLYAQARRSAGKKLGWYVHATVYVLVNLALMALSLSQGRHWVIYPALFWGLGLLMHGVSVWLASPQSPWWTKMVEKEKQRLQRNPSNIQG